MSRRNHVEQPALAASLAAPDSASLARGFAYLLISVLLLSSGWPLTKLAIEQGASPLWFAEGRAMLSGLIAALLLALGRRLRFPVRGDWPALLAVGAFQLGAYFALAHLAVAWVAAGRTAVLANTTTIFVIPLSLLVLREPIPPRRWAAAALSLGGVAVLVGPWAIDWGSRRALIGNGFLLGAALCWSVAILVLRARPPASPMASLLPWSFLIAALILLPLLIAEAPHGGIGDRPGAWGALGYVGLLAGPLGTWGVIEATVMLPAVVASVGFLATPAFGILLSNWILGEPITSDLIAGTVLILVGVGLAAWPVARARRRR
ncbi:MAG: DMT family transporter [Rhodospirillales bacterium]|nr:DMT family transporter [Rhodospirillales bacterium]